VTSQIERLRQAVRTLHGLNRTHFRSVPVRETVEGKTVWDGTVEVFSSTGKVRRVFA
jgi:hypothetical protein